MNNRKGRVFQVLEKNFVGTTIVNRNKLFNRFVEFIPYHKKDNIADGLKHLKDVENAIDKHSKKNKLLVLTTLSKFEKVCRTYSTGKNQIERGHQIKY